VTRSFSRSDIPYQTAATAHIAEVVRGVGNQGNAARKCSDNELSERDDGV